MSYREMPTAGGSGQEMTYEVESLEWINRGCWQASFTLTILPQGICIRHCSLFCKGCSRWVSVPSERFRGEDVRTVFKPLIGFRSNYAKQEFLHRAMAAVDHYLATCSPSKPEDSRSPVGLFNDDDCAPGSEVDHAG
jgi:hypothetical protein